MWGKNLYTGGHFDAYVVDYYDYKPGAIADEIWSVPDLCPKEHEPENAALKQSHWLAKLRSVLPSMHYGAAPAALLLVQYSLTLKQKELSFDRLSQA